MKPRTGEIRAVGRGVALMAPAAAQGLKVGGRGGGKKGIEGRQMSNTTLWIKDTRKRRKMNSTTLQYRQEQPYHVILL